MILLRRGWSSRNMLLSGTATGASVDLLPLDRQSERRAAERRDAERRAAERRRSTATRRLATRHRGRHRRRGMSGLGWAVVLSVVIGVVITPLVLWRHPRRAPEALPASVRAPDSTLAWSFTDGGTALQAVVAAPRRGAPVVIAIPSDVQLDLAGAPPVMAGQMGAVGPRIIEADQSLLDRRVQHFVVSDAGTLSAAIGRLRGITVEVEAPFSVGARTIRGGLQHLGGAAVITYLRGAPTETDRFLRWQDVLDGFMASSGRVGTALGASDDPRIVEPILRTARRARVVVLPTATGVDGLVRPSVNAIRALVSSKVRTAGGPIVRVVVINGSGRPGVADSLAVRLAPLGYEIVAAENDSKKDEWTQIVASGERFLAAADRVRSVMASGTVYLGTQPTGLADVTIVVGKDLSIG